MTSVTQAILERRSARAFLSRPVPTGLIREILDIARRTASSSNMQPWRLAVMAGHDLDALRGQCARALRQIVPRNAPSTRSMRPT